jgi:hypothetical protein
MSDCARLLTRARNSPGNLRFDEVCQLAECHGFVFARQKGTSHRIFKHPKLRDVMNFQSDRGKAKAYQVRQLLDAITELESSQR